MFYAPKVTVLPSIKPLILDFLNGGRLVTGVISHVIDRMYPRWLQ